MGRFFFLKRSTKWFIIERKKTNKKIHYNVQTDFINKYLNVPQKNGWEIFWLRMGNAHSKYYFLFFKWSDGQFLKKKKTCFIILMIMLIIILMIILLNHILSLTKKCKRLFIL